MTHAHTTRTPGVWDLPSVRSSNALQTVMGLYQALEWREIGPVLDALAESIDWMLLGLDGQPFSGRRVDREGVRRFFEALEDTLDGHSWEAADFLVTGERVVVVGHERGVVRASGANFDVGFVHIWDLAGGRVTRWRGLIDLADAVAALRPAVG